MFFAQFANVFVTYDKVSSRINVVKEVRKSVETPNGVLASRNSDAKKIKNRLNLWRIRK